jgi:alpha-tubulin suppressor-like RCC1 family protein
MAGLQVAVAEDARFRTVAPRLRFAQVGVLVLMVGCPDTQNVDRDSSVTDGGDDEDGQVDAGDSGDPVDSGDAGDASMGPDAEAPVRCDGGQDCALNEACSQGICVAIDGCKACTKAHPCNQDTGTCDCSKPDNDEDGVAARECGGGTEGDCDDDDGDVSPGMIEECDPSKPETLARDEDCNPQTIADGTSEETLRTLTPEQREQRARSGPPSPADADADGYVSSICSNTSGIVGILDIVGSDCDDRPGVGKSIHPSSTEACNDVDDDCDGLVDELLVQDAGAGEPSEIDGGLQIEYFRDKDGDSFAAVDGDAQRACADTLGAGWISDPSKRTDPDDDSGTVFPGAPEVCDGLDNDGDGGADAPETLAYAADYPGTHFLCAGAHVTIPSGGCPAGRWWCEDLGPAEKGCNADATSLNYCKGCNTGCKFACGATGCDEIVDVQVGELHSCARSREGRVACWGATGDGRLGHDNTPMASRPVWLPRIQKASLLSVGRAHACVAMGENRALWCWGDNAYGQLGRPVGPNLGSAMAPIAATLANGAPIEGVVSLAAGVTSTCAVLDTGELLCFGRATNNLLGASQPEGVESAPAIHVVRGNQIVQDASFVDVGLNHACMINRQNNVECWGSNTRGQLGVGNLDVLPAGVHAVVGIDGPVDGLAVGDNHACAIARGRVFCWGLNRYGEFGLQGAGANADEPSPMLGIDDATSVSAGLFRTCVERRSQEAFCVGNPEFGDVLPDVGSPDAGLPIAPKLTQLRNIRIGAHHGCALSPRGTAVCWGMNENGQLGAGTSVVRADFSMREVLAALSSAPTS